MTKYTCPHCGEEQSSITEWCRASHGQEWNLVTGYSNDVRTILGQHEDWTCPSCDASLPSKLVSQLVTHLEKTIPKGSD